VRECEARTDETAGANRSAFATRVPSEWSSTKYAGIWRGLRLQSRPAHDAPERLPRLVVQWRTAALPTLYNVAVPIPSTPRLERVRAQLLLYEHPLLSFSAAAKGDGVEVAIQFKDTSVPVHTYSFELHPRDLDDAQFEWSFQRQLYDALHDYFVEMFIRTPQDRADRHRKGL